MANGALCVSNTCQMCWLMQLFAVTDAALIADFALPLRGEMKAEE